MKTANTVIAALWCSQEGDNAVSHTAPVKGVTYGDLHALLAAAYAERDAAIAKHSKWLEQAAAQQALTNEALEAARAEATENLRLLNDDMVARRAETARAEAYSDKLHAALVARNAARSALHNIAMPAFGVTPYPERTRFLMDLARAGLSNS